METANQTLTIQPTRAVTQTAVSIGFGGFLALMGVLSFPLPWTPVPFSMTPFGLLVTGAAQRPGYAALSAAIYLMAGGLGAPIFAGGESGFDHFLGATAGYLFGFLLVPSLVSWYLQRRRSVLPTTASLPLIGLVLASVLAGIGGILWAWQTGNGLSALDSEVASTWGVGRSVLWFLLFLIAAMTGLAVWTLQRNRGERREALSLFLVMLGSIAALHGLGVTVLWFMTDLSLAAAIILGSLVFLPFDILKAGAATALALPFLPPPTPSES